MGYSRKETFHSIIRDYYKNSLCACIVYDISNQLLIIWVEDCRRLSPKTASLILVVNKIYLEDKREVTYDEESIYAQKNGMVFFKYSAKTGKNMDNIFMKVQRKLRKE